MAQTQNQNQPSQNSSQAAMGVEEVLKTIEERFAKPLKKWWEFVRLRYITIGIINQTFTAIDLDPALVISSIEKVSGGYMLTFSLDITKYVDDCANALYSSDDDEYEYDDNESDDDEYDDDKEVYEAYRKKCHEVITVNTEYEFNRRVIPKLQKITNEYGIKCDCQTWWEGNNMRWYLKVYLTS